MPREVISDWAYSPVRLTYLPARQVIDAEQRAIDREAELLQASIQKRKVYGDEQESERIQRDAERRKDKLDALLADEGALIRQFHAQRQ